MKRFAFTLMSAALVVCLAAGCRNGKAYKDFGWPAVELPAAE